MNRAVEALMEKLNTHTVNEETQVERDTIIEQIGEYGIRMTNEIAENQEMHWWHDTAGDLGPVIIPGSVRARSLGL